MLELAYLACILLKETHVSHWYSMTYDPDSRRRKSLIVNNLQHGTAHDRQVVCQL